jgi:hypothetical protein
VVWPCQPPSTKQLLLHPAPSDTTMRTSNHTCTNTRGKNHSAHAPASNTHHTPTFATRTATPLKRLLDRGNPYTTTFTVVLSTHTRVAHEPRTQHMNAPQTVSRTPTSPQPPSCVPGRGLHPAVHMHVPLACPETLHSPHRTGTARRAANLLPCWMEQPCWHKALVKKDDWNTHPYIQQPNTCTQTLTPHPHN